ncbi:2Fe-2S iron-sulfur cluster-binding protein [Candidatus Binatia bacterium]|nr:2Fe-2S iron-sulfur cluster-binding protein [Candidatus Binatia bacterium]
MSAAPVSQASGGLADGIDLGIDGRWVRVPPGTTILGACRNHGIEVPTLCYLETLTPANACRLCVVEIEGARALVQSCTRLVEPGLRVHTQSERVRHARRMVLEMLASSVDLTAAPALRGLLDAYGCDPTRYGPAQSAHDRDGGQAGHPAPVDPGVAAGVAQPVKIDNNLYVRDYGKCVLCYRCVATCGADYQNTFAIGVAGRGFEARIGTEFAVPLPASACVYCGNCVAVCPTGALLARDEYDLRGAGRYDETRQSVTDTVCPYCGIGCTLRLHVQDGRIVKVTSPLDNSVTRGNLCIKGRFGWRFVHDVDRAEDERRR